MSSSLRIEFRCPNGHPLRARPDKAGKEIRCPKCKAQAVVPARKKVEDSTRSKAEPRPEKIKVSVGGEALAANKTSRPSREMHPSAPPVQAVAAPPVQGPPPKSRARPAPPKQATPTPPPPPEPAPPEPPPVAAQRPDDQQPAQPPAQNTRSSPPPLKGKAGDPVETSSKPSGPPPLQKTAAKSELDGSPPDSEAGAGEAAAPSLKEPVGKKTDAPPIDESKTPTSEPGETDDSVTTTQAPPVDERLAPLPARGGLFAAAWFRGEDRAGYRPDASKLATVYWLGLGLMVVALIGVLPVYHHVNLVEAPTWAKLLALLTVLQIVYVIWMVSLPDWSTVWVLMLVYAVAAALYGFVLSITFLSPWDQQILFDLHTVKRTAPTWCGAMLLASFLAAFVCGRTSYKWYKNYVLMG